MSKSKKWTREEAVKLFEILLEKGSTLFSSNRFRQFLSRNQNLLANQITREANGNIAYKTVHFPLHEEMSDDEFWQKIDTTPYQDLIEENAAVAIMKMAEKLKIV